MQLVSVNHAHHSVKPKRTFCNRPSSLFILFTAVPFHLNSDLLPPFENQSTTQTSYWQLQFSPKKKIK